LDHPKRKLMFAPLRNFRRKLVGFLHTGKWSLFSAGWTSFLLLSVSFPFSSCTAPKNAVYFQNLPGDTTLQHVVTRDFDLKIRKGDMLGITVTSLSPDVAFYNGPQNSEGPANGYLVDGNGNIPFVKVGPLHVEGMTRKELKDTLQKLLVPYLKEAVVSVGFLNRHVTMLGGVAPAVIPMVADHMTIFDALAASGDIGTKGKIDNVLVIREKGDSKEFERLNLKNSSVFYSPYYYLQPDDIVYVEPVKAKQQLTTYQAITMGVSMLTTAVSLYVIISKL
jgi:polysaccharide biosynthesis/export protein